MAKYKNDTSISLSMAVWLAEDTYDHNPDPNTISVTGLIKPLKQIVLGMRIPQGDETLEDISSLIASKMGSSIHESIEHAWVNNYKQSLKDLGYPPGLVKAVRINPTDEELNDDIVPVYMEQRSSKKAGPLTISGKYDFIGDGRLEDFKSTGTYTFIKSTNDEKYKLQGSIYRWLNPNKITNDHMAIQYIFTDWQATKVGTTNYPSKKLLEKLIPLMSLEETDAWVNRKVDQIMLYKDKPEVEIPECNDEDLWRSDPVWKYYKSGKISTRSTKNFTTAGEANMHMSSEGRGIVVEVKGEVRACRYCSAAIICTQKDKYIADGTLKL